MTEDKVWVMPCGAMVPRAYEDREGHIDSCAACAEMDNA